MLNYLVLVSEWSMAMLGHMAVVTVAFAVYALTVIRRPQMLTASSLFLYIQMIMALGTFVLLDPAREADMAHAWTVTVAMLSYIVASGWFTMHAIWRTGNPPSPSITLYQPTGTMKVLLFLSILITLAYYAAVGSSALVEGLRNALTGSESDIASIRFDAYSGPRYLFPGYVNQFKNSLLPALVVVFCTYWWRSGRRRYLASVLLITLAAFGLLGTGQRGQFVMFVTALGVYMYLLAGRHIPKGSLRLVTVAGLVMILSTVALGRTVTAGDATVLERSLVATEEVADRVLVVQQQSGVEGFRYIYEQPIANGAEWARALTGVLPGSGGSDLSNRIFEAIYGTARGTAPPSLWGSIYHNFGWIGVVVVPGLLGFLFAVLSLRGITSQQRNTLELIGIAGAFTVIGFWASDSPLYLLNSGLLVYLWMWWWGARVRQSMAVTQAVSGAKQQGFLV